MRYHTELLRFGYLKFFHRPRFNLFKRLKVSSLPSTATARVTYPHQSPSHLILLSMWESYLHPVLTIRQCFTILYIYSHRQHSFEDIPHGKGFEVQIHLSVNKLTLLEDVPSEGALWGRTFFELESHELGLVLLVNEHEQERVLLGFQRERQFVWVAVLEVRGQGESSAGRPDVRGLISV